MNSSRSQGYRGWSCHGTATNTGLMAATMAGGAMAILLNLLEQTRHWMCPSPTTRQYPIASDITDSALKIREYTVQVLFDLQCVFKLAASLVLTK
uniref:Uncharacterized protein n=1 Tax=Oryza glumipatula TaxID=40148 RepID=A0A0D9Y846_9ORYZ